MTKKFHIVFLFLTLGFFLMSTMNYACAMPEEKMTCEKTSNSKEKTSDSCEKDCCKKKQNSKKEQHGCDGKCNHSRCTTTSGLQYSLISINEFNFNANLFNFSFEKTTPYYKNISISDDFTSIWLRPKIK